MKKLSILLVVGFALTLFFFLHAGTVYAQCPGPSCTTWTSNVTFNVQNKNVVTNKQNVQSFVVKKYPFTGVITLFTDTADGDPTAGTVTPPAGLITAPETATCYIGIVGTQGKDNPTPIYVCISKLVNVAADKAKGAGENAIIVGTGEVVSSTDTGLVFLQATWQETDVAGLPTSISLVSVKFNGGSEPLVGATESTGGITTVSIPAIKFSKE